MFKKLFAASVMIILGIAGFVFAFNSQSATNVNVQNNQIVNLLKDMKSGDWSTRKTAFYELLEVGFEGSFNGQTGQISKALSKLTSKHPDSADEMKLTLIQLLETENNFLHQHKKQFEQTGETLTEEYTNYHGDLIATVANLKDSRAVNALSGAIDTGNMATNALADLAPFSINVVTEKIDSADLPTRNAATIVFSKMLEPTNINRLETEVPGSREKIKQLLIGKTKDPDHYVKLSAISGLAKIPDADVIKVLENVSKNDLFSVNKSGVITYPVRDTAKKHLAQIKQR